MKKYWIVFFGCFMMSCAANTMYETKGYPINTVLDLLSIGARLVSLDDAENQEGLHRLSELYGVDVQTSFNNVASTTKAFIARLKKLRVVMEQSSDTRGLVDPQFFEEFDKILGEIPVEIDPEDMTLTQELHFGILFFDDTVNSWAYYEDGRVYYFNLEDITSTD